MASLTFIIMATQPEHKAQDEAGKYRRGDIVDVKLTKNVPEPPHPNSRFVFIDVPDVPLAAARKIKRVMGAQRGEVDEEQRRPLVRRRTFYVDHTLIPSGKKQELLEKRRVEATWTQLKGVAKKRETEVNLREEDFND